ARADKMIDKIQEIYPEIVLLITACVCLLLGLARQASTRRVAAWAAGLGIVIAAVFTGVSAGDPSKWGDLSDGMRFADYAKMLLLVVGLLIVVSAASLPDRLTLTADVESGKTAFDPALI